jgi:hypothetical protein
MLSRVSSFSPYAFIPPQMSVSAGAGNEHATARREIAAAAQEEIPGENQRITPPPRGAVAQAGETEPTRRSEEKPTEEAPNADKKPNGEALSAEEQREVTELAATDRKVRQHEMAHMAAGGELITSGARYEYQQGPDGQRYAVAGEVGIDTSEGRTPEETLIRARRIRAAALAPADPSPQDRSVAAAATQMEIHAQQEIAQKRQEAQQVASESTANAGNSASRAYQAVSANDDAQPRFSAYA